VQGVTEVLPVSSSAHLALLPHLLGWPALPGRTTLAAGLHAGSCAGIALALRRDLPDLGTAGLAAATSGPAALAGLLAADAVEQRLGRPGQLAALQCAAALALAAADRRPQQRGVGAREAALAAVAQVAALAPGVSRSGAALTALRGAGVHRAQAQRFSVLMSLPVTAGAAGLTLVRADRALLGHLASPLAVGVPAAAVSAYAAAGWSARRGDRPLAGYALYRLALAAGVAVSSRRRGRT